ncbi:bZIP transcription factor 1-D [Linum perenne]
MWVPATSSHSQLGCHQLRDGRISSLMFTRHVDYPNTDTSMDLERAADWTSNSNSATSSSSSSFYSPVDRMVRIELEAAEALADLAHLAMRENGGGSPSKWGSKGKRAKKRVKSESPPHDSPLNPAAFDSSSFKDPPPDPPSGDCQQPMCETVASNHVKPEQDAHLHSLSARSFPSYGGGRSRQSLTEAEKEARRLRRILANRESARQTIRRRQALCEELTRKSASLALENENLKREKELVLKEQQFLESTNKQLKTQMAHKAVKAEEEAGVELKPSWFMPLHQPANCQMIFYNQHPFSQLCWPSIIQSSNAVQSQQETHETRINDMSGRTTSLCVMSYPWFLPVADSANGQNAVSVDDQCSGSSSSHPLAAPLKLKPEAANSPEVRVITDLNEIPVVGERGGDYSGKQDEVYLTPASVSCVAPTIGVKSEISLQSCSGAGDGVYHHLNKATQPAACGFPDKACGGDPFSFTNKKPVDAAAATVARRRRKELTRLKHLHGARQCRMNC